MKFVAGLVVGAALAVLVGAQLPKADAAPKKDDCAFSVTWVKLTRDQGREAQARLAANLRAGRIDEAAADVTVIAQLLASAQAEASHSQAMGCPDFNGHPSPRP